MKDAILALGRTIDAGSKYDDITNGLRLEKNMRRVQNGLASELASNLRVMIEMGDNFDHGIDCSMAEWSLCYTRTINLEYLGEEDYTNR